MALHPCCLPFIFSKFKLDSLARKADSFDSAGGCRSIAHPESRGLRKGSILSGSGIWQKKCVLRWNRRWSTFVSSSTFSSCNILNLSHLGRLCHRDHLSLCQVVCVSSYRLVKLSSALVLLVQL